MPSLKSDLSFWLRKYNVKPNKDLGQCFLVSESALGKIVAVANIKRGEKVLEIGGGTGVLTQKLLEKGGEVLTIEKDSRLALILHERFDKERKIGKLKIIQSDFLDLPFPETLERLGWKIGKYKVVANLPYQITSPAIERIMERSFLPSLLVLTIQKEVAERICAEPGELSSLAVLVQTCTQKCTLAAKFPPSYFYPSPVVDSALLKLEGISYSRLLCHPERQSRDPFLNIKGIPPLAESVSASVGMTKRYKDEEESCIKNLRRVVRAGFAQKRKKLKKNLQNVFEKEAIENIWSKLNIPENTRAQELPVEKWVEITSSLFV